MVNHIIMEVAGTLEVPAEPILDTYRHRTKRAQDKIYETLEGKPHLQTGLAELYENIYLAADTRWHEYKGIKRNAANSMLPHTSADVVQLIEEMAGEAGPVPTGPAAQHALVRHL